MPYFLAPLVSPRASGAFYCPRLWLTQAIILLSFGIPRMIFFRYRQFAPAPCSPPLGGSDAGSAVRFTAAVKYGGRENWPSGRETRCMSNHPCRAHHKLKWARKGQSVIAVLYSHLPRSESTKAICAAKFLRLSNSARSTLSDRRWQQPLNNLLRFRQSSCSSNGSRNEFAATTSPRNRPQRPRERTKPLE